MTSRSLDEKQIHPQSFEAAFSPRGRRFEDEGGGERLGKATIRNPVNETENEPTFKKMNRHLKYNMRPTD